MVCELERKREREEKTLRLTYRTLGSYKSLERFLLACQTLRSVREGFEVVITLRIMTLTFQTRESHGKPQIF